MIVRLLRLVTFSLRYSAQVVAASLRVAHDVLTPRAHLKPGIIAVPLRTRTDAEVAVMANLTTLTPGTLSLDVSPCRQWLYVHGLFRDLDDVEQVRRSLVDETQAQVLRLMRGDAR